MYEAHFGLKSRPFGSKAEGAGVFVGPQQAKTMTSLNKGLGAVDAVVTVTGPAGVGKTTIVERALEQISPGRTAARIGRMHLSPQEALELLFGGFGIKQQAQGTIRRFAAFRQLLAVQAAADAQVAIIIEDAERIGADTLAELEAITAADTGDGTGANIILMGQPALNKMLMQPELARLNQRTRLRARIEPLGESEVLGYLKHLIRQAGGDFEQIFDPGAAEIVFNCSQGIPRVINTLCEMAMTNAMEEGVTRVDASFMHQVAVDAFGYEGPVPQDTAAASTPEVSAPQARSEDADIDWEPAHSADAAEPAEDEAQDSPAETPSPIAEKSIAEIANTNEEELPPSARNIVVESGRYPELPEVPDDSPLKVGEADEPDEAPAPAAEQRAEVSEPPAEQPVADATPPDEHEIPELINDTQPELSQLSVANVPEIEEQVEIDPDAGSTAIQEKPDLEALAAVAAESDVQLNKASDDTFDLDAALAIDAGDTNVMQGITPNLDKVAADNEPPAPAPEAPSLDDLPTLSDSMRIDVELEVKKAKATMDAEEAPQKAPAPPESTPEPAEAVDPEPAPEMILEPDPEIVALAPGGPAEPENVPAPPKAAEPEPAPAPAKTKPDAPARPAPVAQVSEMTARIAMIDPDKRMDDVDALEAALVAAKKGELDKLLEATAKPGLNGNVPADGDEPPVEVPEITLDETLADEARNNPELDEFAAEIAKANSLEEFSDKMAETLFGNEEFDAIAAEVVANPPQADPGTPADQEPVAEVPDIQVEVPAPAAEPPPISAAGDLRQSQAVRADMLNSLRTEPNEPAAPTARPEPATEAAGGENVELSTGPGMPAPKPKGPSPDSIEDQITTMTQNLEALDVSKMADTVAADDEPEPKKSGGLFSRFRKSS